MLELGTKPVLGQCARCQGLAYVCDVDKIYTAADMEPLDYPGAVAAVGAGRDLYKVHKDPDTSRPRKLTLMGYHDIKVWGDFARINGFKIAFDVVASHGCGAEARSVAPWTPGSVERPKGPAAPTAQSPAPSASQPPSEGLGAIFAQGLAEQFAEQNKPFEGIDWSRIAQGHAADRPTCETCGHDIWPADDRVSVEVGNVTVWARHTERCA